MSKSATSELSGLLRWAESRLSHPLRLRVVRGGGQGSKSKAALPACLPVPQIIAGGDVFNRTLEIPSVRTFFALFGNNLPTSMQKVRTPGCKSLIPRATSLAHRLHTRPYAIQS